MNEHDKMNCPSCNAPIWRTDSHCMDCGAALDEGRLAEKPTGRPPQAAPDSQPDSVLSVSSGPTVPYTVDPHHSLAFDARSFSGGSGVWSSARRALEFTRQGIVMAFRHAVLVVPSVLSVLTGLALVALFLQVVPHTENASQGSGDGESPLSLLLIAGFGMVFYTLNFWFMGMTADLVSAVLRGRAPSLGHAWNESVKNAMALVSLAALTVLVDMLTRKSRRQGSSGFTIAAEFTGHVAWESWRVASYLLVPVIILEDISLKEAFKRVIKLHEGSIVGIIVGEVAVRVLLGVVTGLCILLAAGGAAAIHFMTPAALPLAIALAIGFIVLVAGLAAYVRIAYYTCLYEWAAATETAETPIPAPAPLAKALSAA